MKDKNFKTIESVARFLLKNEVGFTYKPNYLVVKDTNPNLNIDLFNASYHAETKELVLMNHQYEKIESIKIN